MLARTIFALLPFTLFACMKINVGPLELEDLAGRPAPGANAPLVHVRMLGKRVHRNDWARARSMYRAFASGVVNKSGSLKSLSSPALRSILGSAGFRARFAERDERPGNTPEAKHAYLLLMDFKQADLVWQPPREFIQTPTARSRGYIELNFHIVFDLHPGSSFAPPERPALLRHVCREKNRRQVLPGTQREFMGTLAHRVLSACLNEFSKRFIAAGIRPQ